MKAKAKIDYVRNPNGFPATKFITSGDAEQITPWQSLKLIDRDQMIWGEVGRGWYLSWYGGKEYVLEIAHFHNPSKNCWFFDGNQWVTVNRSMAEVLYFAIAEQLPRLVPNYPLLPLVRDAS